MLYNEQHPLFAPYNDDVMGERFAGRYERLGEDEEGVYKRWYFDNGHNYTLLENTNMLMSVSRYKKTILSINILRSVYTTSLQATLT